MEDIFAIQDEIAEAIVEALKIELTPEDKADLGQKTAETDPQAYDFYLRGRKAFWDMSQRGYETARQMFARALIIDPQYARAYAGVADCCSMLYMYFEGTQENLREARAASARAIQVDPGSAMAHASRGLALSLSEEIDEASEEFERAIEIDPKLFEAHYFYARALFTAGVTEKAAKHFEMAAEVNTEDYQAPYFLGLAYTGLDRPDDAMTAFEEMVRRTKAHLELHPDEHRPYELGASAYVRLGEPDLAKAWVERATMIDPKNPSVQYNAACTYAQIDEIEKAIDALENAAAIGWADIRWAENDPDLDSLRDNERFRAILDGLRKS
jgi:tetratricopeptide (TPR) repeat protein